ncbi:MAG TPA: HupE/UreJ family protein [Kofleriaceae bacterium]|nr:HupE/UreJ family protein [Kofleriaceae bacterium]
MTGSGARKPIRNARAAWLVALLALVAVALPRSASAHPLDLGYLRIEARGTTVAIALDVHATTAAHLVGLDPATVDAAALAARAGALADASYRAAPLETELGACHWTSARATLAGSTASLTGEATCPSPVRQIRWALPFVQGPHVSPTFQILVKAQLGGEDRVAIVDRARPSLELTAAPAVGFAELVWTGVEHIGAAPDQWHDASGWRLPDGIDHILFLCALMLAGGTLWRILGIVSGFTIGHSITLALSALHIARPPASVIEPLIALSIAVVAAEALADRALFSASSDHRWKVAACFGLVHGFGFAGALDRLDLSTGDRLWALLAYNLGVELGQVAIVLAAAPLLLALQRHRRFHPVVRGLAAAILIAGTYWFVQRIA